VLCATARNVSGSFLEQLTAMTMPFLVGAVGVIPSIFPLRADLVGAPARRRARPPHPPAVLARMRRMPLVTALAAMQACVSLQLAPVDRRRRRPCAVLVTRHDTVVPPSRQMRLARALPAAQVVEVDGDHDVFLAAPGAFAHALAPPASPSCQPATCGPATPSAPADRRAHAAPRGRPEGNAARCLGDPGACAAPAHAAVPAPLRAGAGRTASRISSRGR
jgi:hypothetical protein